MLWFALIPGFVLCSLVICLWLCEMLKIASSYDEREGLSCPLCGSLKPHFLADEPK